jgi:hypothetical protein
MKAIGKPYAGKPHVRFDEGVQVKQLWLKYKPQPNNVTPDPTLLAFVVNLTNSQQVLIHYFLTTSCGVYPDCAFLSGGGVFSEVLDILQICHR